MATVNLGRIKPVFRGAYNNSTAYVVDDIVTDSNETFICILASTGNATSNATYWTKLAAKGADGTDVGTTLTTQGDILYRDGSGLQRLGAGTSGQFLKTQGTGANPVWADSSGAWVKLGEVEHTGSSVSAVDVDFTPNDSVYAWYKLYITNLAGSGNGNPYLRVKTGGSTNTSSIYGTGGYGTANNGSGQWSSERRDDTGDNRMHLDQTWTAYTDTDRRLFYEINFYKGSSSANKAFFWQHIVNHDSAYYIGTGIMGGTANVSAALTGFTITLNTGSITDVNAYVLGFKP